MIDLKQYRSLSNSELEFISKYISNNDTILELGTYKGQTARALAKMAKKVITIDHHHGNKDTGYRTTLLDFLNEEWPNNIIAIRGYFEDVLPLLNIQVGIILSDGTHTTNNVIDDYYLSYPLLKPGGFYFLHDIHLTEVKDAIERLEIQPGLERLGYKQKALYDPQSN